MKNHDLRLIHRHAYHTSYRTTSLVDVPPTNCLVTGDNNRGYCRTRQAVAVSRWK